MSIYEIISIALSLIALIIASISFFNGKKVASASIELSINDRITTTKEKVNEYTTILIPLMSKTELSDEEKRALELYGKQFNLSVENNLNAYEEAVSKYLDDKVDRKRFKKLYQIEIRQLVEKQELKKYFDGVSSRYKAILKVYNEWENHEK
jgi:hypothetical protein